MNNYVLTFQEINKTKLSLVGGKAVNLAELSTIKTLRVPTGFCVTTEAYRKITENNAQLNRLLDELTLYNQETHSTIREISAKIREIIERTPMPKDMEESIVVCLKTHGNDEAFAVRSSATAEDLQTTSFAGQQDSYLNIIGKEAVLKHIRKCWASLFTDRAVIYRIQNGFDHRDVYQSVIIQRMIFPQVAGVLFTADPVTSNRKVLSIDASLGLGESLVSGLVNADNYKVVNNRLVDKKISVKDIGVYAAENGGTEARKIAPHLQDKQVLSEQQVLELARIGRKIEEHFGYPQDIEWCLKDERFYIVQSRPITTLYPVPEAEDKENRVYVSVGHQQMMTDPIKPLGISIWLLTGARPIFKTAGGRLFVDITAGLGSSAGRQNLLDVLGHSDPLIKDALSTIIARQDFIKSIPDDKSEPGPIKSHKGMSSADILQEAGDNPAIVDDLITQSKLSLAALKQLIKTKSGPAVFDCILEDLQWRRQHASDQKNLNVIMAAIHASAWINEKMGEWLGEKNVADTLSLSVANNVTSEMGMELSDAADVLRPYPKIIEYMEQTKSDTFLADLLHFEGGQYVYKAITAFLDKYGMRCAGEIDITRTRWSEAPIMLVPMILNNIKNLPPESSKYKFEQGRIKALKKEKELLARLRLLPSGDEKAKETKQMIDLIRNFIAYREYPKYDIVCRYFTYKQALLKEAAQLVQRNVIREKEDIYYLSFEELREAVDTHKLDYQIVSKRREAYKLFEKLSPPRIITSDGEIITGVYQRGNIPAGALVGLPVSSGVIEGRARIILDIKDAHIEDGDILITTFTDPSWTPLFVSLKGVITEVGGLMTHGAVVAREYGLPAIVGVEHATKLIKDGQIIRLNGTEGYVEVL